MKEVSLEGSSEDDQQVDNEAGTHTQAEAKGCLCTMCSWSLHFEKGFYILFLHDVESFPCAFGILWVSCFSIFLILQIAMFIFIFST